VRWLDADSEGLLLLSNDGELTLRVTHPRFGMTKTYVATVNGKPRKQLSDQLDRLDRIIDALGEALPEAVTDACKGGAKQAVKEAIIEIMTNPELRGLLATTTPPAQIPLPPPQEVAPARPSFWSRVKSRVAAAASTVRSAARTLLVVVPLRKIVVAGTALSAAVALLVRLTPSALSAVVAGTCAAVLAASGWLRRQFQRPLPAASVPRNRMAGCEAFVIVIQ